LEVADTPSYDFRSMIRIVTDSSCDIPTEMVERHRITVVPLTIRFGDDEYVDGEDLTREAFWPKLAASPDLPETAAPSAGRFQDAFLRLADEGAEGIVVICLSAQISATYQSAVIAAEKVADRIRVSVVDSQTVTMAAGFQALAAARAAEAGANLAGAAAAATGVVGSTNLFAALDTLEFLKRGGRIGNAQAFFGSLLNVKPLITFQDGVVAAAGRARTRGKALAAIAEHVAGLPGVEELTVLHGAAGDVERLTALVAPHVAPDRISVAELGPVVGTHAGPGVIGVAYRLA
jgi:DegV family protein with EDD domain